MLLTAAGLLAPDSASAQQPPVAACVAPGTAEPAVVAQLRMALIDLPAHRLAARRPRHRRLRHPLLHLFLERAPVRPDPDPRRHAHRDVAATTLMSGYELPWGEIMATGTLIVLPVILFSIAVSRHLVRGLTMGAVK
jgi:hypothetical protein